jgi:hypothetical protein
MLNRLFVAAGKGNSMHCAARAFSGSLIKKQFTDEVKTQ